MKTHVWVEAVAALIANAAKAMADVEDTEQRAATRSALGLAAERAGCREDFNRWDFAYLAEALESKLRLEKVRHVGDGLLCALALADSALECIVEHRLPTDEETKNGERERLAWERHGRFDGSWRLTPDDPLFPTAAQWRAPAARLLFAPAAQGGLGLAPELGLTEAGVVAESHLTHAMPGGGYAFLSWEEARRRNSRLVARNAAAWKRVVAELEERGCTPARPERVGPADEFCSRGGTLGQWCTSGAESEGLGVAVHAQRVEQTIMALREDGGKPAGERKARREWEAEFKACFPGAER